MTVTMAPSTERPFTLWEFPSEVKGILDSEDMRPGRIRMGISSFGNYWIPLPVLPNPRQEYWGGPASMLGGRELWNIPCSFPSRFLKGRVEESAGNT